jgi:hypothetical protein
LFFRSKKTEPLFILAQSSVLFLIFVVVVVENTFLILAVILFNAGLAADELDVGEGEVTHLPAQLSLPLAVHRHLGHFDDVAYFKSQSWKSINTSY